MGLASALNAPFAGLHSASLPGGDCFLSSQLRLIPPQRLTMRPNPHRRTISTLTLARRRNRSNPAPTASSSLAKKNNKKKKLGRSVDEDEIDEDAIEALFAQLEEDLKKADPSLFDGEDDDEEISEEDLAKLDEELARVFDITDDDLDVDGEDEDEDKAEEDEDEDEDEEEEEEPVKLRNWQLRRLASALKIGRRKTNIKSLAAELCLDRAVVLEMLREPPPSLLMMAATLPDDEPSGPIITLTDTKTIEEETVVEETPKPDTSAKVPVHVKQQRLSSQKRIKKVDIQTLESVYRRSKRPTVRPRKLFTNEEKLLLNKRIPDLKSATSEKWLPLHTLAASGEFYFMDAVMKHNADVNAVDKDGWTAIHKAILGKKQAVTNYLLREDANPFVCDKDGATLMHYAVRTASSQAIKILLLYNVDINTQDNDGWTPLHLAVQSRRTDVVKLLLIKGADKTLKNKDGLTPLEICLCSGRDRRTYELIKLLKLFPKQH